MHLVIAHKSAVHPGRETRATGHVEHVAHAKQGLGAHLVQNGAAVDLAADLKADPRGNIGLDQTGDHVHRRALGGQDEVNARRSGLLRQSGNQFLDLLAHHHHQVGQFVDHHHDVGQSLQRFRLFGGQAERIGQRLPSGRRLVDLGVVAGQVAHPHLAHQAVTLFHLAHAPVEALRGLLHVGHHGGQQVRNPFVHAEFQHLGVDEQQAHVSGIGLVQQAQDHGIDPHRLAGTRGARHQAVRHLGQVGHDGVAGNVLAQAHGQQALGVVIDLRAEDFTELDGLAFGVGKFQRHDIFARDGLDDADAHQRQGTRQVLGEVHHLRAFHAGGRFDLVAGDHRPGLGRHHLHLHAKIAQLFLDQAAGHLQGFRRHGGVLSSCRVQQIDLRQLGVGQILKERLLPLFRDARAHRHFCQCGLDLERLGLRFAPKWLLGFVGQQRQRWGRIHRV